MFILTYATAILSIAFGVFAVAFAFRRRDPLSYALAAYLGSIAIWIAANAAADVSYTSFSVILASQIAFAAGTLSTFFSFLLVDFIIERKPSQAVRALAYGVPGLALFALAFSPFLVLDTHFPINEPAQILPGFPYLLAVPYIVGSLVYGIVRFWSILRKEPDYQRRMQARYVFLGLLATGIGQIVFDTLLPVLGEQRLYSLGPLTSLFFAVGCGYAITRHRFLDIRFILQRGILYTLLFGFLITLYISLLLLTSLALGGTTTLGIILSAGATVIIGTFGVPPIERWFRTYTDPVFFKDQYDYAEVMHALSRIPQTTADSDELVGRIEETLRSALRAEFVTIALSVKKPEDAGEAFWLPIEVERRTIGHLLVGSKRSGDPYAAQDVKLLTTFANQAATALSRIRLHKETLRYAAELEVRVAERTQRIQSLQEEQRRMMLEISHNLQTPLAVLQARIDHSGNSMLHDGERSSMQESIASLSGFIYDLLSFANLEERLEVEERTQLDLSELMESIIEEMRIITAASGIETKSVLRRGIRLHGNERRLREAVMNIASNAVKYIGNGPQKHIRFELRVAGGSARIRIQDTGIGIPEEALPRIFDRFYRAERDYAETRGSGLGLSIARRIVEQHGGMLEVESVLGTGTTFTLYLPLPTTKQARPRHSRKHPHPRSRGR